MYNSLGRFLNCTLLLALLALSYCIPRDPAPQTRARPPVTEAGFPVSDLPQGQFGGRLILSQLSDPRTFNPIIAEDAASGAIGGILFPGLTRVNPVTLEPEPELAERWEISEDQRSFTFYLRRGLTWSDGHPFSADDVIFSLDTVIQHPSVITRTKTFLSVDGKKFDFEKIDDYTIRITTPDIYAPFLIFIGTNIIPKHIYEQHLQDGTFMQQMGINTPPHKLPSLGPFRLMRFVPGQRIIFERNPYYWTLAPDGSRLPYLDHLILNTARDANAAFIQFLSGKTDAENIRPEDVPMARRLAERRGFSVIERGPSDGTSFLWFNQNTGTNPNTGQPLVSPHKLRWFRDTRFRQAVSYALDREGIIQSVFMGMAVPLWSCESPANVRWFNPNVKSFPRDLARARALLADAGFKQQGGTLQDSEGHPVEFTLITNKENTLRSDIAVVLANNLAELGIAMRIQLLDFNALIGRISDSFDYEACLLGLTGGASDPSSALDTISSFGRMHLWFPQQKTPSTEAEARMDELMQLQLRTLDYNLRKRYYDEVQQIMAREQFFIYLVTPTVFGALRDGWQNLRPPATAGTSLLWNHDEIWRPQP